MKNIPEYLTNEHSKCDELFATTEQQVARGKWGEAAITFGEFLAMSERHFSIEEQVLFRYIERTMGNAGGPTQVMRMEHSQMRGLLMNMKEMVERQDSDGFLGESETLLVLMQQHNMKEEQIVYPMAEKLFADGQEQVIAEMESL